MICYFAPNFIEIRLRKSGFHFFVVLRNHAEGKSVISPPFWNGTLFSTFFFSDNHNLTHFINGAIFIGKFYWKSGFWGWVRWNPSLGTIGWEISYSLLVVITKSTEPCTKAKLECFGKIDIDIDCLNRIKNSKFLRKPMNHAFE